MIRIESLFDIEKYLEGIKAVVFDVDDTLHTEADYARAGFNEVAKVLPEIENFTERLMAVHKQRGRALQKVLLEEGLGDRVDEAFRIYSSFVPEEVPIYSGAADLLRRLRASGYKLGIISDGLPAGQHRKINAMGLPDLVDEIIVTDDLGGPQFRKPCIDAFVRMRELLGVEYEEMVYVGDNIDRDIEPCEKLGIRAVHFNNPKGFYYLGAGENRLPTNVLAIDIGASSMRGVVGRYNGKSLQINEIGRYPTPFADLVKCSYWDFPAIFNNVISLIREAQSRHFIHGIGIDCFGGCLCFIDREGNLLENPAYRYSSAASMKRQFSKAQEVFGQEDANKAAGFDIRGEYRQALKMKYITEFRPEFASAIDKVLFLSSAISYYLCGKPYVEQTQLVAQQWSAFDRPEWNYSLADAMGLRRDQLSDAVAAGTVIGPVPEEVKKAHDLLNSKVVAVAEHDTASAMSLLTADKHAGYLSLGTIAAISVPSEQPVLSESAAAGRLINESCYGGGTRLTRNINGLYFVRQCRRIWEQSGLETDFAFLDAEAAKCPSGKYIFEPADPKFRGIVDIPAALNEHFGTELTQGETIRAIYDSLAEAIASALEKLENETGRHVDYLSAVGGGIRSALLCQTLANATGRDLKAVNPEGAALGNICVQLIGLGKMQDMAEALTALGQDGYYRPEKDTPQSGSNNGE